MVRSLLFGLLVCMLSMVVWSQRSPIRVAMVHEDDVEQIKAIVLAHAGEDTGTDEYKAKIQVSLPTVCTHEPNFDIVCCKIQELLTGMFVTELNTLQLAAKVRLFRLDESLVNSCLEAIFSNAFNPVEHKSVE